MSNKIYDSTDPNAAGFKYGYDSSGNVAFKEDGVNGRIARYAYDFSNRFLALRTNFGFNSTYSYDSNSNVNSKVFELNKVMPSNYAWINNLTFDNSNKMTQMTWNTGTLTSTPKNGTLANTYDGLSRLTQKTITTYNSGTNYLTKFAYKNGIGTNQTTSLVSSLTNGTNATLSYTYDANGNIQTASEGGTLKITYYYDNLNQLIGEENVYLGKTIAYDYDTAGNVVDKTEYASGVPYNSRNSYNYTTLYHYSYDSTWKDLLISYTITLYGQSPTVKNVSYGNVSTTSGLPTTYDGWSFTWQHGRELAGMSAAGNTLSFKYDDNGIRTQKTVNGVKTTYYLDQNNNVIYETNGTDIIYYTYDNTDSPISMNLNGTDYYYVKNLQGDIISIINTSGTAVVNYTYNTWGKLISTTGTLASTVGVKNPYRYRGYRYDTETGFYYLQSRYYNPELGRFINADITEILKYAQDNVLGSNLFAYCGNNAVMGIDPSGYLYISNSQLWSIIKAAFCTIGFAPVVAVIIGLGVWKIASLITLAAGSIGVRLGWWAGPVGWVIGGLFVLCIGSIAVPIAHALIQGRGLYIGWYRTWWGMPYALNMSPS